MIDTLPAHLNIAQVRALHPRAMIIRHCRKAGAWLVFHSVEAAHNHSSSEAPRHTLNRPIVMNRSW